MAGRAEDRHLSIWRGPHSFTAWVPVHPPRGARSVERIRAEAEAQIAAAKEDLIALCNRLGSVHSLRIVLTPRLEEEGFDLGMLLNIVHDETDADIVDKLATGLLGAVGPLLRASTSEGLRALLLRHELRHHTLFIANIRVTVRDVWAEHELYRFLQEELDDMLRDGRVGTHSPPDHIRSLLRERVLTGSTDLPREAAPPLTDEARRRKLLDVIRTFANPLIVGLSGDIFEAIRRLRSPERLWVRLLFFLYLPVAALIAVPAALVLILVELTEPDVDTGAPPDDVLDAIEDREDMFPKNAVTLLFPVRHSWIRRVIMHRVLAQAEQGCRHFWTRGRLVQIETIHYARLLMTPSRRTMVFMSDYDGALDRYLDDFLGVGQRAVVPISSSVHGCPPTRLMKPADMSVFRGRWRTLIRRHQHLEAFWYSAYRDLDTDQIRNHRLVRQGLFAESLEPHEAEEWLRRL